MSLAKELQDRGFIYQSSNEDISLVLDKDKRTIYHGIDPSASSAHAGNFVIWMLLKHLQQAGHKIIFLVGGATGLIGDPKPDAERTLLTPDEVTSNLEAIRKQAENFFGAGQVEFVNNYDWFQSITLIDFLRETGKHFTVNELVKREAISKRLESDTGLSYTEFAYPLIQGYDFLHLYQTHQCTVQVGGSDQWGNIVSGVDLVRRVEQHEVFALTTPLVVDKATGKKFGKSEGNAVWLDPQKTSPFRFYQFWLNTSDESVIDYLKLFTLVPLSEIEEIQQAFEQNPGTRGAQKRLAEEVTALVHGQDLTASATKVSEIIFGNQLLSELNQVEKEMLLETAPTSQLLGPQSIIELLVEIGLAASKREARMFIKSRAIELQGEKIVDPELIIDPVKQSTNLLLLKRGKKQVHVLQVQ
jgi:tyrosyl-tRNA synthetase